MSMTRKLDRYIARTFGGPFVLCLAAFVGLYVIIDFFSNIDEFIRERSAGQTLLLAAKYYAVRIPWYVSQVMPVLVVVPAVICMIRLQRTNEVCGMQSAGISARRVAAPLLACAGIITMFAIVNQEVIVPGLRDAVASAEQETEKLEGRRVRLANVIDSYGGGRLLLIGLYDPEATFPTLRKVHISWDSKDGIHHEIKAERAFAPILGDTWYMEGVQQFDGEYTILREKRWKKRETCTFTSTRALELLDKHRKASDAAKMPLMADDFLDDANGGRVPVHYEFGEYSERDGFWPVGRSVEIVHPSNSGLGHYKIAMMVWTGERWRVFNAWRFWDVDPEEKRLREEWLPDGTVLESSVRPADVVAGEFKRASAMLALGELANRASQFPSQKYRQRCWVTIWRRLGFPLSNLALTAMAVALVFRRSSHTGLIGISMAVVIALLYMLVDLASVDMGYRQVFAWSWAPFAGIFPTGLFAGVGVWLFSRMERV